MLVTILFVVLKQELVGNALEVGSLIQVGLEYHTLSLGRGVQGARPLGLFH